MKASFLADYFEGDKDVRSILNNCSLSVKNLSFVGEKKGASTPIEIENDIDLYIFSNKSLLRICNDFLNRKLTELEMSYILTAVELSDAFQFSNERVEDIVSYLTDYDSQKPIDISIVKKITKESELTG